MKGQARGVRVQVFLGESEQEGHRPRYQALLEYLRREGAAGATVTRGIAGFGANSKIKTSTILRLSLDLPVVLTWIDAPERVERLVAINCPPPAALADAMRRSRAQLRKSWYILFFQLPWLPERRMAKDGAAVVARALVGGAHRRGTWPAEEIEAYRAAFARPGRAKAAIDWYRAAFRPTLRRRRRSTPRARVAAPTLVLWGVEDRFLERELVSPGVLRRVLADGNVPEMVFVDDAGHFLQNEAPDRVNEELVRWLGPA